MIDCSVQVTAPARIHFGLLSFGHEQVRQFGGVGAMVDRPETRLRLRRAPEFAAHGGLAERVREFAESWSRWYDNSSLPPCRIEVLASPEPHSGLGTGTQLGLAVAAGLNALISPEQPATAPAELASCAGRARRSAVGTHGFLSGGLILESGKRTDNEIASLEKRVAVPDCWRFLLMTPRGPAGLSGRAEENAFDRLPCVPRATTEKLLQLARHEIMPAAEADRFDEFAEAVYAYGSMAGECFADVQGSVFGAPAITHLVNRLRNWGVRGVGQSSWGPTTFAVLPDAEAASRLVERLRRHYSEDELRLVTTPANNSGATIEVHSL